MINHWLSCNNGLCATGDFCAFLSNWGLCTNWCFVQMASAQQHLLTYSILGFAQQVAFLQHVVYYWSLSRMRFLYLIRNIGKLCPIGAFSHHGSSLSKTSFSNFPDPYPAFFCFSNHVFLANLKYCTKPLNLY